MTNAHDNRMTFPAAHRSAALPHDVQRSSRAGARARRLVVATLAAALVALWPALAAAQFTTGTPISIGAGYPLRSHATRQLRNDVDNTPNTGINRADCDSDETWSWTFVLPPGLSPNTLQVWASASNTSCADPTVRGSGAVAATCWRVAVFQLADVLNGKIVKTRSTDMIKAAYRMVNADDTTQYPTPQDICYPQGNMEPTRFYLHFLPFLDDVNVVDFAAGSGSPWESTWDTIYDLAGPLPPTGITLGAGQSILVASWPSTANAQVPDFVGYTAYCFPKRGSESDPFGGLDAAVFDGTTTGTTEAGTSEAGAVDATSGADAADTASSTSDTGGSEAGPTGTCPPTLPADFVVNALPSNDIAALECGSVGSTGGTMTISGLQNGVSYAVAIAGMDNNSNSGQLSQVVCMAPQQTTDFFDAYRADGGKAGGGYCGFGRSRGIGALAGLSLATAATLVLRRRGARR